MPSANDQPRVALAVDNGAYKTNSNQVTIEPDDFSDANMSGAMVSLSAEEELHKWQQVQEIIDAIRKSDETRAYSSKVALEAEFGRDYLDYNLGNDSDKQKEYHETRSTIESLSRKQGRDMSGDYVSRPELDAKINLTEERFGRQIDRITESVDRISKDNEDIRKDIKTINERIQALSDAISGVVSRVQNSWMVNAGIALTALAMFAALNAGMNLHLDNARAEHLRLFGEIYAQETKQIVSSVDSKIEAVDARIEAVDGKLEAILQNTKATLESQASEPAQKQ